ncbi:MAG TPA: GTP-binding protein [Chloroflexota bacterium]|nr:GTP-binding protein [Chloroflexota bacterium]
MMQFDLPKPRLTLGAIGHEGHGKTSLLAAIARTAGVTGNAASRPLVAIGAPQVECETASRRYKFVDYSSDPYSTGTSNPLDGVILVVAATDGPMPGTQEHILAARRAGIPAVVVFLNKTDVVDDPDLLDLVELEIRELLAKHDFSGDQTPIIRGSARAVEQSRAKSAAAPDYRCIHELLRAIDTYVPTPGYPHGLG